MRVTAWTGAVRPCVVKSFLNSIQMFLLAGRIKPYQGISELFLTRGQGKDRMPIDTIGYECRFHTKRGGFQEGVRIFII
jgi:hypothetical protein